MKQNLVKDFKLFGNRDGNSKRLGIHPKFIVCGHEHARPIRARVLYHVESLWISPFGVLPAQIGSICVIGRLWDNLTEEDEFKGSHFSFLSFTCLRILK